MIPYIYNQLVTIIAYQYITVHCYFWHFQYGTPSLLSAALEELSNRGEEEQGKMLAGLKFGKSGRCLGPALSVNISRLYTKENLL